MPTTETTSAIARACARLPEAAADARPPARRTRSRRGAAARVALGAGLAGLFALAGACTPYVQGNGVLREETRTVDAFQGVSVSDGILVTLTAGAADTPQVLVTVSGDENIVHESLQTDVRTDSETGLPVLQIYVSMSNFASTHPLRVSAAVPVLKVLRATGVHAGSASEIDATVARVDELRISAADEAIVKVPGAPAGVAADRLDVVLSGRAWLSAEACEAVQADVHLTGASRAELRASGSVTGSVSERSVLENAGAGTCAAVTRTADSTVTCAP